MSVKKKPGKHLLICEACQGEFRNSYDYAKFCGDTCRRKYYSDRYRRKGLGVTPGTTGAISELLAAAELMKNGWEVYRALSPASYCDLLAVKRGEKNPLFFEVRTGYLSPTGKLVYPIKESEKDKKFIVVTYEPTVQVHLLIEQTS